MDIGQVLIDVVLLLGVGALLGALFERVRQSAIIGYLLAGTLLRPNVLHLIRSVWVKKGTSGRSRLERAVTLVP